MLWTCVRGHERRSVINDVNNGSRCARCSQIDRKEPPRKPRVLDVGTRCGDLEVVENLGVIDGFSRVRVRNVTNGVEAVMTPSTLFNKTRKWKLLTPEQVQEARVAAGKMAAGRPNPANAVFSWADAHAKLRELRFQPIGWPEPSDDKVYDVKSKSWRVRCFCGNEFGPQLNGILFGGVRSCGCVRSHAQNELAAWIKGLGHDVIVNDREVVAPMELDVWVPALRLGIEYDGLHWHGELLNGTEARRKLMRKSALAEAAEIRLVVVFEDEWLTRRVAVEGYLKALLGRRDVIVGARTCEIIVDDVGAREAMGAWHLQGAGGATTYSLRHADHGLVAVMSWGRPNASRAREPEPGSWELVRFAVRPGYGVPGGAGRLLKAFLRDHSDCREVISYSDNRWSVGNLYRTLGFEMETRGRPSYWYFGRSTQGPRVHRFRWTKQAALKAYGGGEDDTEWSIMARNGWDRIWDLGATRWVRKT